MTTKRVAPIIDMANVVLSAHMVSHVMGRPDHNREIIMALLAEDAKAYGYADGQGILDLRLVGDSLLVSHLLKLHDLPAFMQFHTQDTDELPYIYEHDKVVTVTTDAVTSELITHSAQEAGLAMHPLRPEYKNTMISTEKGDLILAGLPAYSDDDNGLTVDMNFGDLMALDAEDIACVLVEPSADCREIENPSQVYILSATNTLADSNDETIITVTWTPQMRCLTRKPMASGSTEYAIHDFYIKGGQAVFYNSRFGQDWDNERIQHVIDNNCDPANTMPHYK